MHVLSHNSQSDFINILRTVQQRTVEGAIPVAVATSRVSHGEMRGNGGNLSGYERGVETSHARHREPGRSPAACREMSRRGLYVIRVAPPRDFLSGEMTNETRVYRRHTADADAASRTRMVTNVSHRSRPFAPDAVRPLPCAIFFTMASFLILARQLDERSGAFS